MAKDLDKDGYDILFTCREKECVIDLLSAYKLKFFSFGKPYVGTFGKIFGLLRFNAKMLHVLRNFQPSMTIGHSSFYAAQMSKLRGITHISLEDTGNMEQVRLYKPFSNAILVPDSFLANLGKKQLAYAGNHELSYLHPKRFIPDPNILEILKIHKKERFTIMRFVAWNASHDKGHSGISHKNKVKALEAFSALGRVFISSEIKLSDDLEPFRLNIRPEKFHDVLAFSSLFYGESATVASEACVLGVPAIYIDKTGRCYTKEEQEKYGMVFNFSESQEDQDKSISKGIELLLKEEIKRDWQLRREKLLDDKIDVTSFLVWFIENYPDSHRIMKENPDYQYKFR